CGGRSEISRMRSPIPHIMNMIGNGLDIIVGIRIKMLPGLTLISGPLDNVEQMGYYTNGNKWMSIIIEIDSPWVTCALGKDFEFTSCRMVPPYAGIQFGPLVIGGPGFAHVGMCEYPVYAVQPTVRSPT